MASKEEITPPYKHSLFLSPAFLIRSNGVDLMKILSPLTAIQEVEQGK